MPVPEGDELFELGALEPTGEEGEEVGKSGVDEYVGLVPGVTGGLVPLLKLGLPLKLFEMDGPEDG